MSAHEFELDLDTALEGIGLGSYEGQLADRWNVGAGMNGGYLAAFCLQAVRALSGLPDPLSMTLHYLSRPVPGLAGVRVVAVREGRGHATYRVDLVQAGESAGEEVRATGLVLMGKHRQSGPLDFMPVAPFSKQPDQCAALRKWAVEGEERSLFGRLEQRVEKSDDVFFLRSVAGEAATAGWMRLADGRPSDALCAPLFLDCWPPAIFSRTMKPGEQGAPTLEFTVHWRNPIAGDWLFSNFRSDMLAGGYVDEKGSLWAPDGVLVAESRQLARYAPLAG